MSVKLKPVVVPPRRTRHQHTTSIRLPPHKRTPSLPSIKYKENSKEPNPTTEKLHFFLNRQLHSVPLSLLTYGAANLKDTLLNLTRLSHKD